LPIPVGPQITTILGFSVADLIVSRWQKFDYKASG
jgi:hypothetical protein